MIGAAAGSADVTFVTSDNPRSEDPATIVARTREFLRFFDADKISLNPDCGFGTFAERPVATPEVAGAKLRAIVTAAQQLRTDFAHT